MNSSNSINKIFNISIGIMAYNEESNIGQLLQALLAQKLSTAHLKEIYVVASGCTDRTEDIVREYAKKDTRIKLLLQQRREGKASAINLFLAQASGDIFVLESADTIPEEETLEKLVFPFTEAGVGMTGAHPVPLNTKDTFIGFAVNLMWSLHHQIALAAPKLGELVAFRSFIKAIPYNTAVDEASIEGIVRKAGYYLCYVPDAIVRNKGPENVKDFLKQRRRIAAGHKRLVCEEAYKVSTTDPKNILKLILQAHTGGFKYTIWTIGVICLEVIGRVAGYYDFYVLKKNPYIWDIASSTKNLS